MTAPKKPAVAFWATVVVVAVVAYLLSKGPVVWLYDHKAVPRWARTSIAYFYLPLDLIVLRGPEPIRNCMAWYVELWRPQP